MDDDLETMWKEAVVASIKVLSAVTEENFQISVRIAGLQI
jgi:hypothetical protein